MRVTNSMLTTNLLRNLHSNFRRSNDIQNMMATGRRFANISDNPTAMLHAQSARNSLARLSHFQRTTETAQGWLTQAEISTRELQGVIDSVYERLAQAATDVITGNDKNNIAQEVRQLRNHFVDTLNSTFGNNFVFGGFNTPGDSSDAINPNNQIRPFVVLERMGADGQPVMVDGHPVRELFFNGFNLSQFDGMPAELLDINLRGTQEEQMAQLRALMTDLGFTNEDALAAATNIPASQEFGGTTFSPLEAIQMLHRLKSDVLTFDVGPGIEMPVTMNGIDLIMTTTRDANGNPIVRNAFSVIDQVYMDIANDRPASHLTTLIRPLQHAQDHMLARTAEIGGRYRRLELLQARYEQDRVNNRQMLSDAEDVDMGEVIMDLRMAEAVLQASMAAGARVIQPSLMDFLR